MRTALDIFNRMHEIRLADVFGYRNQVLIQYGLTFEEAKDFRSDEATLEEWPEPSDERTMEAATEYYAFAVGRILGHRGLSAGRSVDKLMEFAWLLGYDKLAATMDGLPFAQYGAPAVSEFGSQLGLPFPAPEQFRRMAHGQKCHDSCKEGCEE